MSDKEPLKGVGETIKQDRRGRCWDMLLDIVSAQKQLFYKSLLSFVNGKLTASQKKASSGGAGWFARSAEVAELADFWGGYILCFWGALHMSSLSDVLSPFLFFPWL